MTSTFLVGGTGLVGSNILSILSTLPTISNISLLARRDPKTTSEKIQPIIEADSSKWASRIPEVKPTPPIFFSALGTTRAQAGGLENQRKIDLDLNVELAKKAKEAGVKVYVLISSSGASTASRVPYSKMKAELDEAVKALEFEHTVLVKPGLIVGSREDSRPPEFAVRTIAKIFGAISTTYLKDPWSQDADVIAKAAISAGFKCLEGKAPSKVWEVSQKDIITLGRTEWKE